MREQAVGNTWRAYMRGRIGVVALNRAPSNALSSEFAGQLLALMNLMIQNQAVEGIVFASDLPNFLAGSDVSDLIVPKRGDKANLVQLCDVIAQSPKPIVAAVHGACMSAGLDLALAAVARVARAGAEFAYTDIKLGLMPAAGGAFRLPALIGAAPALEMLLHGQPISANKALKLNLIDQMVAEDVVGAAVRLAQKIADGRSQLQRRDPVKDARAFQAAVVAARNRYAGQHLQAYRKIIDCVEAGQFFVPEQAQILQQTLFEELRQGQQAQGLCYAFVANHRLRAQPSLPRLPRTALAIRAVNIWGANALTVRLAASALNVGLNVRFADPRPQYLRAAMDKIAAMTAAQSTGQLSTAKDENSFDSGAVFAASDAPHVDFPATIYLADTAMHAAQGSGVLVMPAQLYYDVSGYAPKAVAQTLSALLDRLGWHVPDISDGGAVEMAIKDCLSRCTAELRRFGHSHTTVLDALASYGIGVQTGAILPVPPPEAHEILAAIRAALANCGAALLRKGAVKQASDFDAVAVQTGLFPRWQGGPLYHADKRGPLVMRADLRRRAADAPDLFTPDPLFDVVIADGMRFADYAAA